ncbi:MAG: non-homologous end-joining DNA ligase [Chloroflexota bacterium]|jgi:bifunctional non-homologous end joining protein LigD
MSESININGHTIELSRQDKIFYPEVGITKGDVVNYYRRLSEIMLPHMEGRPLTMQRFPDGIEAGGFYEKAAPDYFPKWIRRVKIMVEEKGQKQEQITCEDTATLVYLANQACLTPHIWLSRADKLDHPDKLIFDLDPSNHDFEPIRQTALDFQDLLEEIGLVPYVMTTGSRGVHVVAPLERSATFDTVRKFVRDVADVLANRHPDRLTVEQRKEKREGRLFLDYLRNAYGQNSVAPYSLRARPEAPIATPLDWSELHNTDLHSQSYTIDNIFRRMGQKKDPWRDFRQDKRSLGQARQKLDGLKEKETST